MIEDWSNEEYCLEAVKQDGMVLRYVRNQTPEICLEAVRQNNYALKYVKNQTPEMIHYVRKKNSEDYEYLVSQESITVSNKEMEEFYKENPHLLLTL